MRFTEINKEDTDSFRAGVCATADFLLFYCKNITMLHEIKKRKVVNDIAESDNKAQQCARLQDRHHSVSSFGKELQKQLYRIGIGITTDLYTCLLSMGRMYRSIFENGLI